MHYRQRLTDTLGIAPRTIVHKIMETPSVQPARPGVEYRTRSTSQGTLTYAIVGVGTEKRVTVAENSEQHLRILNYQLSPSDARFDAVLALLKEVQR